MSVSQSGSTKKTRSQQTHPDVFYILNLALWTCVGAALLAIHMVAITYLLLRTWRSMFANMLKSCTAAPMTPFFNRNPVGRILARFTGDLTSVDWTLSGVLCTLSAHAFGSMFPCCYIHARMPWTFTLLSMPFYIGALWLARHTSSYAASRQTWSEGLLVILMYLSQKLKAWLFQCVLLLSHLITWHNLGRL